MKRFLLLFLLIGQVHAQSPAPQTRPAAPAVVNYGWVPPSPEERALAQDNVYTQQLRELVKYNDDSDVLLYRFLYRALKESNQLTPAEIESGRLDSLNQTSFPHCVGFATARGLDILAACDIYIRGEQEKWKDEFSPHGMYSITRQDNLGRFGGSTGSWMVETMQKYGTLNEIDYGDFNAENISGNEARTWQERGVPKEILEKAKDHPVIACALVKTTEEAKASLQNGYPINLCSNIGYNNTRDSAAFLKRQGSWGHSMCLVGWRSASSGREGFLILQSWGDDWASGNIYPEDMPKGAFFVSPQDLQLHLNSGDCYAMAGYQGFKRRPLKWDEIFKIGEEINVNEN